LRKSSGRERERKSSGRERERKREREREEEKVGSVSRPRRIVIIGPTGRYPEIAFCDYLRRKIDK